MRITTTATFGHRPRRAGTGSVAGRMVSSTTAQATVVIGTGQYSQTGVPNHLFPTGCTLQQLIDACAAAHPKNRGGFVDCVSSLTSEWVADGVITSAQKDAIMRAAGQARR